jgi:hypothetical protein
LVISEVATLEEIERHYSVDDVYRANAILDMKADLESAEQAKQERRS